MDVGDKVRVRHDTEYHAGLHEDSVLGWEGYVYSIDPILQIVQVLQDDGGGFSIDIEDLEVVETVEERKKRRK